MNTKTPALCPVHKLDYDTFGKYATSTIPVEDFLYKKLLGPSDVPRVSLVIFYAIKERNI
jgi:hypothetical protein